MKQQYNLRLPLDLLDKLKEVATKNNTTVTEIIIQSVKSNLK